MRKSLRHALIVILIVIFSIRLGSAVFAVTSIPEVDQFNTSQQTYQETGNPSLYTFTDQSFTGYQLAIARALFPESIGIKTASSSNGSPTASRGMYGSLIGFIGDMYQYQPATTERYVADVLQDMHVGIAQPAYAQGLGFSSLDPILSVWKKFRDIAYLTFVLIFLVIGFMIMFRQKIGGQAVVTAQQAIPNIIVALIAVTFSYAIAGLLIDAMYLVMYLLVGLFQSTANFQPEQLLQGNVFQITGSLIQGNIVGTSAESVAKFVNDTLGGGFISNIAGVITGLTAGVVIILVIIFNTFRLFIALLKTYIELILSIAFAPLILMTQALPGNNAFASWVRGLIANLAVFPTILLLLIVFNQLKEVGTTSGQGFLPPYLGGASTAGVIPFLAGLALILALPEAVDEVKKALGGTQGGIFATLIQAGVKNAQDRFGTAKKVAGMGALMGAGAVGGGLAANYLSRQIPSQNTPNNIRRNTVAGVLGGAAVPLGVPLAKRAMGGALGVGQGIQGLALAGKGLTGAVPELGAAIGQGFVDYNRVKPGWMPTIRTPAWANQNGGNNQGGAQGGQGGGQPAPAANPPTPQVGPIIPPDPGTRVS
jgi:hypothetical protein